MRKAYSKCPLRGYAKCDDSSRAEWKTFYGGVNEAIPPNAPDPRGKSVDLRMWVDSDHAGEKITR